MPLRFVFGFVLIGGLKILLAAADGKETSFSTKNTFTPVLGGRSIEDKGGAVDGSSSQFGIWRYDAVGRKYQSWYFLAPGGEAVQFTYD